MTSLWDAIQSFGWLQWLAFLFNVIYVVLAARQNIWCWLFGFIGVALLFFIYIDAKLYSDALLQVFYMGMSIYGWWSWREKIDGVLNIKLVEVRQHLIYLMAGIAGTFALGYLFSGFGAALPYVDAFTSSFAVVATYMVARKELDNWIYWIIIDLICVGVYVHRALYLIAFLFLIYTVLAFVGYRVWRDSFRDGLLGSGKFI